MKRATFTVAMLVCCVALSAQWSLELICSEIIPIDSATFYQSQQQGIHWDTVSAPIRKVNKILQVITKDSTYRFIDHTPVYADQWGNELDLEAPNDYYAGRWKEWVLIEREDLHQLFYYAINLRNNDIDTLVGYPIIYGNKWLCQESSYCDSPMYIEVWEVEHNKAKMRQKLSFVPCDIFAIEELYLFNNQIYAWYKERTTFFGSYDTIYFMLKLK